MYATSASSSSRRTPGSPAPARAGPAALGLTALAGAPSRGAGAPAPASSGVSTATDSTQPARASSTSATACSTPRRSRRRTWCWPPDRAPPRAAHALQERAHRVGRLGLEHAVEVAHVDAQLQRGGADDAGVAAVVEALLGARRSSRDTALWCTNTSCRAAHVARRRPRWRAALAEEQALLALRDLRAASWRGGEVGCGAPPRAAARAGHARRITPPGRCELPCEPLRQDRSGLPTVALRPMRCTSCRVSRASRSITLIRCAPRSVPASAWTSSMTTDAQIGEERAASTRGEISMTSSDSGVVISSSAGSRRKRPLLGGRASPCHTKRRRPTISV
jgi:hypothetical protein